VPALGIRRYGRQAKPLHCAGDFVLRVRRLKAAQDAKWFALNKDRPLFAFAESWLRESGQSVEWIFCLTAARVLVANQEQR
jgi:hypothetical protein